MLTENLAKHDLRVGLAVFLGDLCADGVRVPQRPQSLERRLFELGFGTPGAWHQTTVATAFSAVLIVSSPERRGSSMVSRSSARVWDSDVLALSFAMIGSTSAL